MQQRVAVVTGGARGIGASIAQTLAARGDRVYVFDVGGHNVLRMSSANSTLHQHTISHDSSSLVDITVNVRDEESVRAGFARIIEDQRAQGLQSRLDILINNAGITRDGLVMRMDSAAWDEVLEINLRGAFLCAKHALPYLCRAGTGYIINISSVVGITGNAGQANYASSKAGLIGLTCSLAREYAARNILVNAIAPGFIDTEMTARLSDEVRAHALEKILLRRAGEPGEIAALAAFLTSGKADYITGQTLVVDGGLSLS